MLETIVRQPSGVERSTPLLFVHAFWHGAWSWNEFFLPYFAAQGYSCVAPNLHGHGGSPGRERLRTLRIRDYVDDIAESAAQLPRLPVVVGHSAGGFAVQKYLERHDAAGAVLVASIPPSGARRTTLRVALHHPIRFLEANLTLRLEPIIATPELARELLFSSSMPQSEVNAYQRQLQDESYGAFLDLVGLDRVRTKRVHRLPMLVLGAENDALVSPREVRRTARAYGTEAEIFPHMAHDMMLEAGWEAVAERIARWLDEMFPTSSVATTRRAPGPAGRLRRPR